MPFTSRVFARLVRVHLLLIGIDGLRADLVDEATAPTLAALLGASRGGAVSRMTMPVPTMSGPLWSTLLTGTTAAVHGVAGNDFAGHRLDDVPDLLTRILDGDPAARTLAAVSWLPLVEAPGPVLRPRDARAAAGRHRLLTRDGETEGYRAADADLGARSAQAIAAEGPEAVFVYLGEIDEAGHRFGARSVEYGAAIGRVDALVAGLVEAVEHRADAAEAWLVAVTTDHGHLDDGGHGGPEPEVATSFVALRGVGAPTPKWPARVEPQDVAGLLLRACS